MNTALVTGAGGWIGLELVERLLNDGYRVKAMVRKSNPELNKLLEKYNDQLYIFKGDMLSIDTWEHELENLEYIYHLAAKVHTRPKNVEEENEFFKINRDGSSKLFDLAIKYKVKKVLFVSTVAVYGKPNVDIITQNTEKKPITPYAKSKYEAELYGLKLFKEKQLPISIVQPVVVYGGKDRGNFKKMYNLAQKGLLVQFGKGTNKKSTIYYKDLVSMIKNICESNSTIGKTYICGTEDLDYISILNKFKKDIVKTRIVKIPQYISKAIMIVFNRIPINKTRSIANKVDVLMTNNIYDYAESMEFIDSNINTFYDWDCINEYKY